MVKKFITLDEINKKHLLPLFLVVFHIAYKFFNKYYPEKIGNPIFNLYAASLGMISMIFFPCIFKIDIKEQKIEKKLHKRKWLHYLLLIIIYYIYNIMKTFIVAKKILAAKENPGNTNVVNPSSEGPFAFVGIEMVLLTIVSIILLKYKYFIHHVISIVGFILFGNFSDILLNYYPEIIKSGAVLIIIQLLNIIIDVIYYYDQKYMMEKLYYPYWSISFTYGVCSLVFPTAYLIYIFVAKENANFLIINGKTFYSYFKNEDIGQKIGKQLLNYIFSFIGAALTILNIYHFGPNYILIGFQFSKLADVLISNPENYKYYFIIFFVFQLFFLMIYLEILELNFCNLNKNTKKNIELRSVIESIGNDGGDSCAGSGIIDINKDYSLVMQENEDKNNKNIELLSQNDN